MPLGSPLEPGQILEKNEDSKVKLKIRVRKWKLIFSVHRVVSMKVLAFVKFLTDVSQPKASCVYVVFAKVSRTFPIRFLIAWQRVKLIINVLMFMPMLFHSKIKRRKDTDPFKLYFLNFY